MESSTMDRDGSAAADWTPQRGLTLLVLYTIIYVLPFYLSSKTRPSPTLSRDNPSVIRARIASVTLSCTLCSAATLYILMQWGGRSVAGALHLMGLWPAGLGESARCLALTALLFLGPLFEYLVVDGGLEEWRRLEPVAELASSITTWRNIVIGPLTEEILFRSAGVPLMIMSHASIGLTILLSPLVFGLAHIHHFYEFRITNPQVHVTVAIIRSLFQLSYTTLFGAYATFLFLRTGSLLTVFLVHGFCNSMGLPRVWGSVQLTRNGREVGDKAWNRIFTILYYVFLVLGAYMWWLNLGPLTQSRSPLLIINIK